MRIAFQGCFLPTLENPSSNAEGASGNEFDAQRLDCRLLDPVALRPWRDGTGHSCPPLSSRRSSPRPATATDQMAVDRSDRNTASDNRRLCRPASVFHFPTASAATVEHNSIHWRGVACQPSIIDCISGRTLGWRSIPINAVTYSLNGQSSRSSKLLLDGRMPVLPPSSDRVRNSTSRERPYISGRELRLPSFSQRTGIKIIVIPIVWRQAS